jgi:glycosyltransferase involved in cell wall biosynthesis
MRPLMIVQLIDEYDWLRGFIVPWVRALAERVEHLHVLTLEQREARLPDNVTVYSMGKERRHRRVPELIAFHRTLNRLAPHVDVIFSHMTPRYTWLAAPYAAVFGKPQVLWFAHERVSWELRLAEWVAARIVTASPESLSLSSGKIRVLGQGIDMTHFQASSQPPPACWIVSVGRLAPIKNHHLLIEAAAILRKRGHRDFEVRIAGGDTPENQTYPQRLYKLVTERHLEQHVRFLGAIPYREMPSLYQQAALTVNLRRPGGMDKAVLESMACGVPVMVHNSTFLPLLGHERSALWCEDLAPARIADQLEPLLRASPQERAAVGAILAERVRARHSLDGLMERLVGVFPEVTAL